MTIRPKRRNVRQTESPGPRTRVSADHEGPIDEEGHHLEQPLTYDELVRRYTASEARSAQHVELLCDIYALLDDARGNRERAVAIRRVKEAILATEEVVLDE
ncbi:MAG: hypothetical protein K0U16_07575 [Gammaproteobacteria bacterium]|nr:hypothetical protein [Gammaproteobacteria bacterium]